MSQRIQLRIYGGVTGVGFRSWTARLAKKLQLTGRVRNASSDCVEITAEGQKSALDTMIAECRHGPATAWVKDTHVSWQEAIGEFEDFQITL